MLTENRYKKIKTNINKFENYVIILIHGWENASLPKPKFETRVIEKDALYWQMCFVSSLEKHKGRRKFEKITDLASFKFYSEKWKSVDHKYNKVFGFVNWNNTDEKYAHFLKNLFLTRND